MDYYILGSGGFAKEVHFLLKKCKGAELKGFIDLYPKKDFILSGGNMAQVISQEDFLNKIKPSKGVSLLMGVGDPKLIDKLSRTFEEYKFPNLIHPSFIGDLESIEVGIGNIITAGCIFTVDTKIGSFNIFNLNTTLGHDSNIGNCNVFNPGCNISGGVRIGSCNLFGTNSTVLQNVAVGDYNTLGASSLANKTINDNSVMIGVPAKPLI